jgi:hypothetical protein
LQAGHNRADLDGLHPVPIDDRDGPFRVERGIVRHDAARGKGSGAIRVGMADDSESALIGQPNGYFNVGPEYDPSRPGHEGSA